MPSKLFPVVFFFLHFLGTSETKEPSIKDKRQARTKANHHFHGQGHSALRLTRLISDKAFLLVQLLCNHNPPVLAF